MENIKPRKGQSSSFDIVVVLVAIIIFLSMIAGFSDDRSMNAQSERVKNDYTHSLLISMMHCTINETKNTKFTGKTFSDLTGIYFVDLKNESRDYIKEKIKDHITLYLKDQGVEWVFYAVCEGSAVKLWVPYNKTLKGTDISSASKEIIAPDGRKIRTYIIIRWN